MVRTERQQMSIAFIHLLQEKGGQLAFGWLRNYPVSTEQVPLQDIWSFNRVFFFNWSQQDFSKIRLHSKSYEKSSKCLNLFTGWNLDKSCQDRLKIPPCNFCQMCSLANASLGKNIWLNEGFNKHFLGQMLSRTNTNARTKHYLGQPILIAQTTTTPYTFQEYYALGQLLTSEDW